MAAIAARAAETRVRTGAARRPVDETLSAADGPLDVDDLAGMTTPDRPPAASRLERVNTLGGMA